MSKSPVSKPEPQELLGWWFSEGDTLPHDDGRKVVIGETLRVEGKIIPCKNGLHANLDPFDALQYAPGPILYKVKLSGVIVSGGDKVAASERTALACRDATDTLRLFARKMALSIIHLWDPPDVVMEYLETGDESKREAAWAASRDAAWAAARAAIGASVASWGAAGDAAREANVASWAASAATGAAGAADASATWAAKAAAAWTINDDAARKFFNELITSLFDRSPAISQGSHQYQVLSRPSGGFSL